MHEFDSYIKTILSDLSTSKKKKYEMADEYRDHLEMLRQEYLRNGLSEENAVKEAIKCFGDSRELKMKLSSNLIEFRRIPNVLIGAIITILIFIVGSFTFTPVQVINPGLRNYLVIYLVLVMCYAIMLLPVGYFLPIIFKRAGKIKNTAEVTILFGVIIGFINSWGVSLTYLLPSVVAGTLGGLLGGLIGFALLRITSKMTLAIW